MRKKRVKTEAQKAAHRVYMRTYRLGEKHRAYMKEYIKTYYPEYRRTPTGSENIRRYKQSPLGKENDFRYNHSPLYAEARWRYRNSPKGIA